MKTCVIFNPVARGDKAQRFRERIGSLASACALKPTTGPGAARTLAAEAVRAGYDTLVAAGGDGTLNEVLNGIGDAGAFGHARLGLVPLGTVNVFAKELGIPMNLERAWQVVQAGRDRAVDVAVAKFADGGRPARRWFVQMAGAGLDSRAIELVNWQHKKLLGPLAYVIAATRAMREPLPSIVASTGSETCAGQFVLLGNGRYYGGRWVLFPSASLTDGVLDATVFPRVHWGVVARCVWNAMFGRPPAVGQARHLQSARIELSSPTPMPFEVEGENVGRLPATFSVIPKGLRVIVP